MNNKNTHTAGIEKYRHVMSNTLRELYGQHPEFDRWLAEIFDVIQTSITQRPRHLCDLDSFRETVEQDWYLKPGMMAYMCYVDRFANDFKGVEKKIPYLKELGVTYLHLLAALKPRKGHNDGGFAVTDYYATNPKYGSMSDLEQLARSLQGNEISPCIDFVLNHTAMDHQWAQKALAGDPYYKDFYFFFDDEDIPKEYEKNLSQVLPETSPGNFTYLAETNSWVWTTFYPYQWDLNYKNPNVFMEMLKVILFLANKGIEVFRLDATAYLWKEKDTNCLNLPEAHKLLQVFRAAMSLAAPAVCLKAEAIVGARYISKYLGDVEGKKPECQLSYHNALMAALWASLATGDVRRMCEMLQSLPQKPQGTSWITYLRCHDDIGWGALTDDRGASWAASREDLRYLNDFYEGNYEGEEFFARGQHFQISQNDAFHGTNGTLASLAGLEQAMDSESSVDIDRAISRMMLLYKVIFSFGGIPLLFMGEEIGLFNDYDYNKRDPARDGRWLHRPVMPQDSQATDKRLLQARKKIFTGIKNISLIRQKQLLLHADVPTIVIDSGNSHVFAFIRKAEAGIFLVVANFSSETQKISPDFAKKNGLDISFTEQFTDKSHDFSQGLTLAPFHCVWLQA